MNSAFTELTNDTVSLYGRTLHRICAVRDFVCCDVEVKAGTLGGWVEREENLSRYDASWIADEAVVYDNAEVRVNSLVARHARIFGNAVVTDRCHIGGFAKVYGKAMLLNGVSVRGEAQVFDEATVVDGAVVSDHASVFGHAVVCHGAHVREYARMAGSSIAAGCLVEIDGHAFIDGAVRIADVYDYAQFREPSGDRLWLTYTFGNRLWHSPTFDKPKTEDELMEYADAQGMRDFYSHICECVKNNHVKTNN